MNPSRPLRHNPPFRAEQVGSFLGPRFLLQAREPFRLQHIDTAAWRAVDFVLPVLRVTRCIQHARPLLGANYPYLQVLTRRTVKATISPPPRRYFHGGGVPRGSAAAGRCGPALPAAG